MVPVHHEHIAREGRGTAFAERIPRLHLAEVFLPKNVPIKIEAVEPARSEVAKDMLAIGDGRRRGKPVIGMMTLVGNFRAQRFLPNDLARVSVNRKQRELMRISWRLRTTPAATSPRPTLPRWLVLLRRRQRFWI